MLSSIFEWAKSNPEITIAILGFLLAQFKIPTKDNTLFSLLLSLLGIKPKPKPDEPVVPVTPTPQPTPTPVVPEEKRPLIETILNIGTKLLPLVLSLLKSNDPKEREAGQVLAARCEGELCEACGDKSTE